MSSKLSHQVFEHSEDACSTKGHLNYNLIHGDCLEKLKEQKKESIHLVVTDPPYFLDGLDNGWRKSKPNKTGTVGGLPVGMKFDSKQGLALQKFINEVSVLLFDAMKHGGFAVFFSQPRLSHRMAVGIEDAGFEVRDILAWHFTRKAQFKAFGMEHFVDKMNSSESAKQKLKRKLMGRKTPQLRPQFETMILAQKPRAGTFIENWIKYQTGLIDPKISLDEKSPSTVMRVEKPDKARYNGHLTVKPVPLIEHLIELLSLPEQVVCDPFFGSGTTAVAALNVNRSFVGVELNKRYIEIAEKRIKGEVNVQKCKSRRTR